MITMEGFPGCCTGHIIKGFAESPTAFNGMQTPLSVAEMHEQLEKREDYASRNGHAFVCAVTNNEQTRANQVLKDRGFQHSGWMSKRQHRDTQVRIWWKHVGE